MIDEEVVERAPRKAARGAVLNFGTKFKYFRRGVLLGLILAVALFGGYKFAVHQGVLAEKAAPGGIRVIDTVTESLNDIGELYVMDYAYTMLSDTEHPKEIFGMELPFGAKEMKYIYSGDLRVGVDLTEAQIDQDGYTFTVKFPSMIGHNTYDEGSIEIFDVKNYVFTNAGIEAYQESRLENVEKVKEKAKNAGVYEKAVESLDMLLTNQINAILSAAGVENEEPYEVEVEFDKEEIAFD